MDVLRRVCFGSEFGLLGGARVLRLFGNVLVFSFLNGLYALKKMLEVLMILFFFLLVFGIQFHF